ncbi:pilus assembly protein [Rhodovulum sp. BSW8]|uniref:Pilus assembly protein n=1 Tax=Rhodovulum visakhapatnamense TaxID=364297 RepID=A0A4R8FMZ7_9RHOB|nr:MULTISPECIES: TadE/TadG family type IV pilus assembly protein [Rhodovulum]OLS46420.1 hypothetical protein BV509_20080 [Rhodovulum sulfidophilum]MBL3571150.1 pilus assembly protein [Rhodovulum visakhapatnamense]MBL3577585.1 pilus assembly protein [Rhodovulum visakhapatnamense]RBO52590.1 pilus assembly protein [Rhodovulum sp. BSW8]TDX25378.1 TadE-like protein [Rhodovulum visakhapatnamense]
MRKGAIIRALGRFARQRTGSVTVEMVILFPILFMVFLMAFELGILNVRQMALARATDIVVRDVRLGTEGTPDFAAFRSRICEVATIIRDCENVIRIEMQSLPPERWATMTAPPKCIDHAETIDASLDFNHGVENELMFIRVCALFEPIFPGTGLGRKLPKNAEGEYALIVTSAFVNEPSI